MTLKTFLFLIVNVFSVYSLIKTTFKFTLFLTCNKSGLLFANITPVLNSEDDIIEKVLSDVALLCLFIIIHSIMASAILKSLTNYLGLSVLHRSLYNIASCWSLEVLMRYWFVLLPNLPLFWNKIESDTFVLACQIFHVLGWLSIFSTIYILDFTELIGTKQVIYMANNLGCPLSAKTRQAQDFFKNMRHPVLCGLLVVLWVVPCMSIDRFLLSSFFTAYLLYGSNLNTENYQYIQKMYSRKHNALKDGS